MIIGIDNVGVGIFPTLNDYNLLMKEGHCKPKVMICGKKAKVDAVVMSSEFGEFSDGVLRFIYIGENLFNASSINVTVSRKSLEDVSLKGGLDYVSTSRTKIYQPVTFWSPFSNDNPCKYE